MTNVVSLKDHQVSLCQIADALIGDAILLKSKLKSSCNLPLPDRETDDLIRALAAFVAAAESYQR